MKKLILVLLLATGLVFTLSGQDNSGLTKMDLMLVHGEYQRVLDTCALILKTDSLDAGIWYRCGLAHQNLPPDEESFVCYLRASELEPANRLYSFMVGKAYYDKYRNSKAEPLFQTLYWSDSLNWTYAYYLTGIYMRQGKYDDAIKIYQRFYDRDSTNFVILDRLGFAYLRKGDYPLSRYYLEKSLSRNRENLNAIKNLSHVYLFSHMADTAVWLLTEGIKIDPLDMDLYARRATIYYAQHRTGQFLDDYLKLLASGDSSVLNLKRAGIGYFWSYNYRDAALYFDKASRKDSADYEIFDYLGRCYSNIREHEKSLQSFYKKEKMLTPVAWELGQTYISIGYEYLAMKKYSEAVDYFQRSLKNSKDENIIMSVANIYDERLNNPSKAISYYKEYLDLVKRNDPRTQRYVEQVKKRLEYLEKMQKEGKAAVTVK